MCDLSGDTKNVVLGQAPNSLTADTGDMYTYAEAFDGKVAAMYITGVTAS